MINHKKWVGQLNREYRIAIKGDRADKSTQRWDDHGSVVARKNFSYDAVGRIVIGMAVSVAEILTTNTTSAFFAADTYGMAQ